MTTMRPSFDRRAFLSGLSAAAVLSPVAVRAVAHAPRDPAFTHGVASGDPLADRVMLWTRIAPGPEPQHPVQGEVALDAGFRQVVRRGTAFARAVADWTVKVDATGLPPGQVLHDRFHALGRTSTTGRTNTLPVSPVTQVRLAVCSCSNYPAGCFHAYAEAARVDELDAAGFDGARFAADSALLVKAQVAPGTLTPQELATLAQPAVPYHLDAWDGYAAARETVLGAARALDKNLVVLAGDTHNAWASNLQDVARRQVGVEFATPSVSSPGLEEYFPNENPVAVAAGLEPIIGPPVHANTKDRGFLLVTATPDECRAKWRYVSTVKSATYTAFTGRVLRTLPGVGQRRLVEA